MGQGSDLKQTGFLGIDGPLAQGVAKECARHGVEVTLVKRHATALECPPNGAAALVRVIALVTWADVLESSLDASIGRIGQIIHSHDHYRNVRSVILCVVPYASFIDPAGHTAQFLVDTVESDLSSFDAGMWQARLATYLPAGCRCRLAIVPMIVDAENSESNGYLSLYHKAIRVLRCVRDEVASKVPDYFSRYPLLLRMPAELQFNASTPVTVARWLLCQSTAAVEDAPQEAVTFVERPVSTADLAAVLKPMFSLDLRIGDSASDFTALDRVFNELLWSDQDCRRRSLSSDASASSRRAIAEDDLHEVTCRLASLPCEFWECKYAVARNYDISKVPGLCAKAVPAAAGETGRSGANAEQRPCYYEGGTGETILVMTPIGVNAGYFASLIEELILDYRIVVWSTTRQSGDVQVAHICNILNHEGIAACHMLTWCSSALLASLLMEQSTVELGSLAMIAPVMGDEPNNDRHTKIVWLIGQLGKHPSLAKRIQSWAKVAIFHRGDHDIEQYAPAAKTVRSPLQHHPVGFWDAYPSDFAPTQLFNDNFIDIATQSVHDQSAAEGSRMIESCRKRLSAYQRPVLTIFGSHDHLTNYVDVVGDCRRHRHWTTATLLGGNHYFLLEHAPAVADLVRRFLRDGCILLDGFGRITGQRVRIDGYRGAIRDGTADSAAAVLDASAESASRAPSVDTEWADVWSSVS